MEIVKGVSVDMEGKDVVIKGAYSHEFGSIELVSKVSLISILKVAASKSDNQIDDKIVEMVEGLLK